MNSYEQELKIALTEREYNILLSLTEARGIVHVNYYFVSEKSQDNAILRVREKLGAYELCYKSHITNSDGVWVSREISQELTAELAEGIIARGITERQIKDILGIDLLFDYTPVGTLTTLRTTFAIDEFTIDLDKNTYLGNTDYELECETNDVTTLVKLKGILLYRYGITPTPSEPKSKRFFDALSDNKHKRGTF
jgi:uncharacterized protein YjbK